MLAAWLRGQRYAFSSLVFTGRCSKSLRATHSLQSRARFMLSSHIQNISKNEKRWKKALTPASAFPTLICYSYSTNPQEETKNTGDESPPALTPELEAKQQRLNVVMEELNVAFEWPRIRELATEGIHVARELLATELVQHPAHSSLRADLHYIEGVCLSKLQQFAEAEEAFLNSLKNNQDYVPALLGVAEASHARESWRQALAFYTSFLDRSVEYYKLPAARKTSSIEVLSAARCKRAMVYMQFPDLQMAQFDAQSVIELGDPKWSARAFLILARVSGIKGNWADQVEFCTLAIERVASLLYITKTENGKEVRTIDPVVAGVLSQAYYTRALAFEVLNKFNEAADDRQRASQFMRLRVWHSQIADPEGLMAVPRRPAPSSPIPPHL